MEKRIRFTCINGKFRFKFKNMDGWFSMAYTQGGITHWVKVWDEMFPVPKPIDYNA